MKTFITIIVLFALTLGAVNYGIKKAERNECMTWLAQSREYTLFEATDWQKAQCSHYGINLK